MEEVCLHIQACIFSLRHYKGAGHSRAGKRMETRQDNRMILRPQFLTRQSSTLQLNSVWRVYKACIKYREYKSIQGVYRVWRVYKYSRRVWRVYKSTVYGEYTRIQG